MHGYHVRAMHATRELAAPIPLIHDK